MNIPRAEHPKPQFMRENWRSLNGEWDFTIDYSKSGLEREIHKVNGDVNWQKIIVPFCPESSLSGIGIRDFIPAVIYRRVIQIEPQQLKGRVLLHFGAVDYESVVYVNGKEAGQHMGGYGSFKFDITDLLEAGDNTLTVYAADDTRSGRQPSGKQSDKYESYNCYYTRTTGIWQSVWLEFVPAVYIKKFRIYPNLNNGTASLSVWLSEALFEGSVTAEVFFEGKPVGKVEAKADGNFVTLTVALSDIHAWDIGSPCLYDLKLTLDTATGSKDIVKSYFGLRSIAIKDGTMQLNGRPVFQRLVLDQGFYPDGIYTAPNDEALRRDIEISMALGFNGARLHEKAFEERFLYHADKMGYLVWGEYANWGFDHSTAAHISNFLPDWISLVERDFNHPSIIGWCPFNETWDYQGKQQDNSLLSVVYHMTKQVDPTRPVIDTSGNYHVETDIYDVHDYEQDVGIFCENYGTLKMGEAYDHMPDRQQYGGQPFFVSEYGGARWDAGNGNEGWGYGNAPATEEEFANRYDGLTSALLHSEGVCAFCYTQLYDVEQEKNGLYTYERKEKFSKAVYERIKAVNTQKAAVED